MINVDALKPCPFCGGEPKWEHEYWEDKDDIGGDLYIACTVCYSTGSNFNYEDAEEKQKAFNMAAEGWNKRIHE